MNEKEINIGVYLLQKVSDDFQQLMPIRYAKSKKTRIKMLRKSSSVQTIFKIKDHNNQHMLVLYNYRTLCTY